MFCARPCMRLFKRRHCLFRQCSGAALHCITAHLHGLVVLQHNQLGLLPRTFLSISARQAVQRWCCWWFIYREYFQQDTSFIGGQSVIDHCSVVKAMRLCLDETMAMTDIYDDQIKAGRVLR